MGRDERINRTLAQSRGVFDRFGRQIVEGAIVVFHSAQDLALQIKSITPVLDPGAPPDAVRLTLFIEMPVVVKSGVAINEFIVGHYPEKVTAQVGNNGGEHAVSGLVVTDAPRDPVAPPEPPPAAPAAPFSIVPRKEDEKPQ